MTTRIDRLTPDPATDVGDDELVADLRGPDPVVRVNAVASADGAATREGRSGGLSGSADRRYFELLRRVCDVVLVGAGTVRSEGYGGMRVSEASADWRRANGLPAHPVLAIVSGSLDLDPASAVFADAPRRPIVFTTTRSPAATRAALAPTADVVVADGDAGADLPEVVRVLRERGLTQVLCEGGPTLLGAMLAAELVDELCLTVSPRLEAGIAPRIARGGLSAPRPLRLTSVHESGSALLLRYRSA